MERCMLSTSRASCRLLCPSQRTPAPSWFESFQMRISRRCLAKRGGIRRTALLASILALRRCFARSCDAHFLAILANISERPASKLVFPACRLVWLLVPASLCLCLSVSEFKLPKEIRL